MVAIVNLYRQMLTGVRLQAHSDSMKLDETFKMPSFNFVGENQISKYRECVLRNLLEVHMSFRVQ